MSLRRRLLVVLAIVLPVCLAGWVAWRSTRADGDRTPGAAPVPAASSPTASSSTAAAEEPSPAASPSLSPSLSPSGSAGPDGRDGAEDPDEPLRGRVVVLDPGHNPGNREHVREIARRVDVGTHRKECDTTGTATNAGYPEAAFTLDVTRRARALLEERGAVVVLTHDGDRPFGPCVDERAVIGNEAGADAAVSVHADGSGEGNRGFHVIVPARVTAGAADTTGITGPSRRLGRHLVDAFAEATGTGTADYLGGAVADTGLVTRGDLGGLNLSRVPKVFLECGNMRDARDAGLLTDPAWRDRAAHGIADGVTAHLLDTDGR
ncbi:N-acetylmuramoyl-L-alanine amidase [Streptomyces sp. TRM43335]|uniref:N-acetylmuramoyl-L-alanine amidase n=1 Tax=Streptomyces taklimakanensis TaxID=2569853 RepID=A0A6G2B9M1_9ACTN|nr:N-acetylmuramoyl-L-alanine amidase [Streptomyces taklimakanensis]MTE18826.1 N-acetylmuramoyl-L-alanine amidase [Streptomyces taklimakanensis]